MVSRRSTGPLRTILPAVAVGLIALGVTACGSGQVTQTDQMQPAVNGNMANVGEIALRNVVIAYPESGSYDAGEDAPLTLAIVNNGGSEDRLTSVSSPAAGNVEIVGEATLPARSALQVVVPEESGSSETSSVAPTESATPSSSPSSPSSSETGAPESASSAPSSTSSAAETTPEPTASATSPDFVGAFSIVLRGLTANLPMGKNVPVTFVFEKAGQVTVNVPIDTPEQARQNSGGGEE